MEFLFEYGWIIMGVVGVLGYFFYVYKKFGKEKAFLFAREVAYKLMLAAQKKFGQDSGKEKMDWVVDRFYILLPRTAQVAFSKVEILEFLQDTYNGFKDFIKEGQE